MKHELKELARLAELLSQRALEPTGDADTRWWMHVASQKLHDVVASLTSTEASQLGEAQLTQVVRALKCLGQASLQVHGKNGSATSQPLPPLPMKPTPEIIAWAMADFSEEEAVAGIREIRETGGYQLEDFLHELGEAAGADD